MKLQDCTHGKIVCMRGVKGHVEKIGMVVGITSRYTLNPCDETLLPQSAIPLVHWSGAYEPCGVYHGNLEEFKDSMLLEK